MRCQNFCICVPACKNVFIRFCMHRNLFHCIFLILELSKYSNILLVWGYVEAVVYSSICCPSNIKIFWFAVYRLSDPPFYSRLNYFIFFFCHF